eukprot:2103063-Ditylum_brightwellii.AAC.1
MTVVEDGLMRYDYKGNKGDDGSMQHAHRASWTPTLHNDDMVGHYHYEKEGDNGLMECAHRASRPPIQHDDDILGVTITRKKEMMG